MSLKYYDGTRWVEVGGEGGPIRITVSKAGSFAVRMTEISVDASGVASAEAMFTSVIASEVELIENGSFTNIANMFSNSLITKAPLMGLDNVTSAASAFSNCTKLVEVPDYSLAKATTVANIFKDCTTLVTAPALNLPLVTNLSGVFYGATTLATIPAWVTPKATTFADAFRNCYALEEIPAWDFSAATNIAGMASGCIALKRFILNDVSKVTTLQSAIPSTVEEVILPGLTRAGSGGLRLDGAKMQTAAIDALFTSLGTCAETVAGNKTINVTGNPGAATCNRSIATAKGWTVVG